MDYWQYLAFLKLGVNTKLVFGLHYYFTTLTGSRDREDLFTEMGQIMSGRPGRKWPDMVGCHGMALCNVQSCGNFVMSGYAVVSWGLL